MNQKDAAKQLRNALEGKETFVTGEGQAIAALIDAAGPEAAFVVLDNVDQFMELIDAHEELRRFPELAQQACEWKELQAMLA